MNSSARVLFGIELRCAWRFPVFYIRIQLNRGNRVHNSAPQSIYTHTECANKNQVKKNSTKNLTVASKASSNTYTLCVNAMLSIVSSK